MIGVSKLLCGTENFGDKLRYVSGASTQTNGVSNGRGPVVVWNCTKTCNLKCMHCYANSDSKKYKGELNTKEAISLIDDFHNAKVPVILFSGGEPLLREDLFELIKHAGEHKIRSTISTNGTLIDKDVAKIIKQSEVGYVGISLDGIGSRHDEFRRTKGCFDKALNGIRNCRDVNQKVGVRFTINSHNYDQLEDIFHLIKEEKINRVCFYHLVYSGRGSEMMKEDTSHAQSRAAMDLIMEKAIELGDKVEILTVDNHADTVYLYLKALKKYPHLADNILRLMEMNGGNRSGIAISNVDYLGNIHADQFTPQYTFGNVKERAFKEIWEDTTSPIMKGLKDRKNLLKGRCSKCKWLSVCNGNFRTRAESVTGDFWASDPACYLSNKEIGVEDGIGLI
ncbi:putative heme d1 biosynthesis radical SAM protein NirJ1 [Clostridium estertheticum]|uniref:Mycofactocin maturase MftC n=1 Tax=Clostridium estertheticum TaxID=238834 RepID=A0A7Y3WTE6_9CLOT|nr:putative heme d1 biosynthesis radical SAM protein NirJ1 [Clostridium estertheticum]MBW9173777.1 putative heme d1 biosynthesis radical SAM protein NirJ1 [Clostridium estertheticum]NNU76933.1 putative heme d1 biosynthesis radical SAM protein NirJ1 [Clostridium estertheticum]WBL48799.1 putative heme d1 biosynthesis radical SAM protein NirJ1 [Clostridium estertheticum]WLC76855.1 putative heme d1 biosynthesis radical SAM protein NirJ1 [Clostridium estertheticum]